VAQDTNDEQQHGPDVDGLAEQLLNRADADSAQLLGPDGLLTQLTQRVVGAEIPSACCDLCFRGPCRGSQDRAREDHPPCSCDCPTSPSPA
jgi:hypothetical protein